LPTSSLAPLYNPSMPASNLVVVRAFATHGEADVAKSLLESSGIPAMIQADTAGGMREHLAWSSLGFRVLVREEDAATARDLLRPPPDNELVLLHTFAVEDEADAALGALLAAGIAAEFQDNRAVLWSSDFDWSKYGFRVLVRKEDADAARQILKLPSGPVG
jgi:hypothetical protein